MWAVNEQNSLKKPKSTISDHFLTEFWSNILFATLLPRVSQMRPEGASPPTLFPSVTYLVCCNANVFKTSTTSWRKTWFSCLILILLNIEKKSQTKWGQWNFSLRSHVLFVTTQNLLRPHCMGLCPYNFPFGHMSCLHNPNDSKTIPEGANFSLWSYELFVETNILLRP